MTKCIIVNIILQIIYLSHSVVGTNDKITNYGGGIKNKIKLLELEGIDVSKYE